MKALKTGFAKWVGALAIATLAPLAQAAPIVIYSNPLLGSLNGFTPTPTLTFSVPVPGLVFGTTYEFNFELFGAIDVIFQDLNVAIGDFDDSTSGGGAFDATLADNFLVFTLTPQNETSAVSIINMKITCDETSTNLCSRSTNNVPEPGTLMLVGAALLAGAAIRRRKPV